MMIRVIILLIAQLGVVWSQGTPRCPRVRHELRKLSREEKQRFADAVWEMKRVGTLEGKELYGEKFVTYDELVLRHACQLKDKRGNQADVPSFLNAHRALVLEFENALLAIDPKIGAIPYWDITLDSEVDGIYYRKEPDWIFSSENLGAFKGDPENDYRVVDGLFANFPVSKFKNSDFAYLGNKCVREEWYSGSTPSVCDECCGIESCVCGEDATYTPTFRSRDTCSDSIVRQRFLDVDKLGGTVEIQFTQADWDGCFDPNHIRTWMEWTRCTSNEDVTCVAYYPDGVFRQSAKLVPFFKGNEDAKTATKANLAKFGKVPCRKMSYYDDLEGVRHEVRPMHGITHLRIGGDMGDLITGPNDPIFMLYHANHDRSMMQWQMNTRELEDEYWHYPQDGKDLAGEPLETFATFTGPFSFFGWATGVMARSETVDFEPFEFAWHPGTTLYDTLTEAFPFTTLFEDPPANGIGYTQEEVLRYTSPSNTLYTYDSLAENYDCLSTK